MDQVINEVARLAADYADIPMLCRTHGQTATPSTMGKEMAVFAYRLQRQRQQVRSSGCFGWAVHDSWRLQEIQSFVVLAHVATVLQRSRCRRFWQGAGGSGPSQHAWHGC